MIPSKTNALVNIARHLPELAQSHPYKAAVIFPEGRDAAGRVSYTHLTCQQLDRGSDAIGAGLRKIGIGRGVRTVLMVKPSLAFFELTFALFKVGAVPVLVDPGIGVKNLGTCLAEAQPEAFIGIPKAHVARLMLRWARKTVRTTVTVGRRLFWGGHSLDGVRALGAQADALEMAQTQADETAAILFTSGSTGVPKGAVYSHGNFSAQVEILRQVYGIEPGEVDLATFPLFGLFGPALGMATVIPDMDATRPALVDPRNIVGPIHDFGITNMFGSPALLERVSRYGVEHKIKLPSLKRVISAGAPVPAATMERFSSMLAPGVEIVTPYGATESLPVASIGSIQILAETRAATEQGAGVCVGQPVAAAEVRIIAIDDDPIDSWSDELVVADGKIGEIVVKGPMVTRSYFNRPGSDAQAKIADADGSVRHRMGDLGYFDEAGKLWFCGRKAHRVQTAEETLYTVPCEAIFNVHPQVYRTALVGVGAAGAQTRVLCVELEQAGKGSAKLIEELKALGAKHAQTRKIEHFLFHPAFPVDIRHNSKIFREKLAVWAAGKIS